MKFTTLAAGSTGQFIKYFNFLKKSQKISFFSLPHPIPNPFHVNKYNLKFYGIEEEGDHEDTEKLVRDVVGKLDVELKPKDIESVSRIYEGDVRPRPIRVKFVRWKDKTKIFYKKKQFPEGITVDEDLTEKQVGDRQKLENYAREAESGGKSVRWQGKQLYVNGQLVNVNDID